MSGISINLNSQLVVGPPTWPLNGSDLVVVKAAAVVSVYPYPSTIGTQKATLQKSRTSEETGADPVIINLTFPPNIALTLLNIIAS
jgi:hypothetical protein